MRLSPGAAVNGLPFNVPPEAVFAHVGEPDETRVNHDGEVEYLYDLDDFDDRRPDPADRRHAVIYRCFHQRLVECTFPDRGPIIVNGQAVVSAGPWIRAQPGALDIARFRISPTHCIAYDYRDPANGSITVYRQGHWDALIQQARKL